MNLKSVRKLQKISHIYKTPQAWWQRYVGVYQVVVPPFLLLWPLEICLCIRSAAAVICLVHQTLEAKCTFKCQHVHTYCVHKVGVCAHVRESILFRCKCSVWGRENKCQLKWQEMTVYRESLESTFVIVQENSSDHPKCFSVSSHQLVSYEDFILVSEVCLKKQIWFLQQWEPQTKQIMYLLI